MERYFPKVAKPSILSPSTTERLRYHPYKSQSLPVETDKKSNDLSTQQSKRKLSTKELNQALLRNLSSEHNPITYSDAADRADRAFSVSTGHQVNEGRVNQRLYREHQERNLVAQRGSGSDRSSSGSSGVLRSVRIYLSGYLSGTTDIEMRRVIIEAGGQTVLVPSQCTHIVTSQWLSGSKTDRFLKAKTHNKPCVVRPEWVFETISQGKRQPERKYTISIDKSHKSFM